MKLLKAVFNFYINASIHVAIAVYALVKITELYFDLAHNKFLNNFIFLGTITGYNFVKYARVAKLHHRGLTRHLKIIQVFSFVSFLFTCFYASRLKIETLLVFIPLGLLTLLYAVPFLGGFQKNLRSIGYLKIVIVAIVWASVTVLLPLYDASLGVFNEKVVFLFLQRFMLVIILILPFDIRDMKYDAASLQTIPKKIGIQKTKRLGFVLLLFCLLLEYFIQSQPIFKKSFFLIFILLSILLMRATEDQKKYYSSFIVEAVPIIWLFLLSVF
ncbi:membrane protein [Tenacibaculum holothuriorum]|uniref:Membrane protein n=1 Tax=Tenacibaculum holothuriorum TaxID=1635173 RepID=A0A1Y2PBW1_9FLAO|nr:hypothetical protein [Tenacibaculum holothuriorum]OSY87945.1 membrane protein [Tenacibaculum holothuriorum]